MSADASSFGLGAVLLQLDDRGWHPVAFASRSLSEVEQRYAQIEKEALATVWACEKFAAYLIGGKFSIETDHKPLVPLLSTKHLDCLPPRVLRFRLQLITPFTMCRGRSYIQLMLSPGHLHLLQESSVKNFRRNWRVLWIPLHQYFQQAVTAWNNIELLRKLTLLVH